MRNDSLPFKHLLGSVLDLSDHFWVDDSQRSGSRLHLSSELQAPASSFLLDKALRTLPDFSNSVWLQWISSSFTLSTVAGFFLTVVNATRSSHTPQGLSFHTDSLKSKALLLQYHCDQAPYLQSGQCTSTQTDQVSQCHIIQSNRCCRYYNIDHFSDLKKQRGVWLINLLLGLLEIAFVNVRFVHWKINVYIC